MAYRFAKLKSLMLFYIMAGLAACTNADGTWTNEGIQPRPVNQPAANTRTDDNDSRGGRGGSIY